LPVADSLVINHFLFLRNIKLSFWQTYSNPTSKRLFISSGFSKTLTVKPLRGLKGCANHARSFSPLKVITRFWQRA